MRLIDLDTLELAPTRSATRKGRASFGDVFYKFRFKSGKRGVLVVLIEHKSTYDRFVAFQILRYEAGLFDQMEADFEKFADEEGRLPVPYPILLCQKSCPQFDDLTSRCEGLDYGLRTRFQEINVGKLDLDALLDEPLLYAALGLVRYAGYRDEDKEERQNEILPLFRSLTDIDPLKRENLKETWDFIFEVSFNYLLKITQNTSFDVVQFQQELFNAKGDEMRATLSKADFERIFADKVQVYKTEVAEEKTKRREAEAEKRRAEAAKRRAEARTQEAEAKAKVVDELFVSTMRDAICDALCHSGKVQKVPSDVARRLKRIEAYSFLRELLRVATSRQNDYASFLRTLDEGKGQGKDVVLK